MAEVVQPGDIEIDVNNYQDVHISDQSPDKKVPSAIEPQSDMKALPQSSMEAEMEAFPSKGKAEEAS